MKGPKGIERVNVGTQATLSYRDNGKECVIPIKKFTVDVVQDERSKYTIPKGDKFTEYEECDMDWLIFFGLAPKVGTLKPIKRSVGVKMTIDGPVPLGHKTEWIDADYCNQ